MTLPWHGDRPAREDPQEPIHVWPYWLKRIWTLNTGHFGVLGHYFAGAMVCSATLSNNGTLRGSWSHVSEYCWVIFCEKCLLRETQINRWISCAHARNWWYTPDWYTRNHIFLAKLVVGWLRYFVGAMVRVLQPFPTTGHWEVAGHTSPNIVASVQNIAKSHILEMWMIIVHGGVHQRRCIAWILESCRIILQCLFSRQLL